ncbi:hypothetical protein [Kitasatospora viridis]|uniref:Lipoprotein n=1 Tax=Kitasatospora viridis TaxID=281105 RepID=A0A561TTU4_9ACTN|nr:hypothetical protein [Kitasatospora viridis]TWF90530.1 hypothetical protein FHX73_13577 [Kitasatospora viridis]
MGRTARIISAGALLLCAAACTGQAKPAPSASGAALSDGQVRTIESELVQDEVADGHQPGGAPVVAYRHGEAVYLLWLTTEQDLCQGDQDEDGGLGYGCSTGWRPPTASTPGLETVWGPGMVGADALTVFLADHEDMRSISCGGVSTKLTRDGEFTTAAGQTLSLYSYLTPWIPNGTLEAAVQLDGGPAVVELPMANFSQSLQRTWLRQCDSQPATGAR